MSSNIYIKCYFGSLEAIINFSSFAEATLCQDHSSVLQKQLYVMITLLCYRSNSLSRSFFCVEILTGMVTIRGFASSSESSFCCSTEAP